MPDYALLAAYLAGHPGPRVSFTFDQVEAILGEPLPLAAYLQPGWWISGVRRGHGAPWTAIGWRVEQVDPYAGTITFARSEAAPDG